MLFVRGVGMDGSVTTQAITLRDAGYYAEAFPLRSAGTHAITATLPDMSLSSSVRHVVVDDSPPVITGSVLPSPSRRETAQLSETDPQFAEAIDAGAYVGSVFRRDEFARVVIKSSSSFLPSSLALTARWVQFADGGSTLPFTSIPPRPVACPANACGDAGFCQCHDIDLSIPRFDITAGFFELRASGSTASSAVVTASLGQLGVTRWKWRHVLYPSGVDAGFGYSSAPAIDQKGNVLAWFRGHSCGGGPTCLELSAKGGGQLRSIQPSGDPVWEAVVPMPAGLGTGPVVGASRVYYPMAQLCSFDLFDGGAATVTPCANPNDGGASAGGAYAAPVLAQAGSPLRETVFTRSVFPLPDAGVEEFVAAIRPLEAPACRTTFAGYTSVVAFNGAAGDGLNFWFDSRGVTRGGAVTGTAKYQYQPDASFAFVDNIQSGSHPPTRFIAPVRSLMSIFGATSGFGDIDPAPDAGLLYHSLGGPIAVRAPSSGYLGGASGVVVDRNRTAYAVFTDRFNSHLVTLTPGGNTTITSLPGAYNAPPLLGRGGLLYLVGNSFIRVAPLDGGTSYDIALVGSNGGLVNSPTIDCTRDSSGTPIPGRPGVMYVIKSTTFPGTVPDAQLYAIIVDSAGIDTTAEWPKHLHDPRNTNNAATDLAEFACP